MAINVIVCDDQPAFAQGLASVLQTEAEDISVVGVAGSAEEAEAMVREHLPELVLMDIRMPGTDGIEATRRIRAASPTTKVMMLTVSDEYEDLYQALRAGATGYVTKDREVSEIADAMRSVMRDHLVIPVTLAERFLEDLESSDPSALNEIEREVLGAIAKGKTNREIADRLRVSERTVRRRLGDIYSKLHLADRVEAAIYAARRGLDVRDEEGPG